MTDIFREVEEDVRREQALKLWRAYGKYVIVAAVAVVLGIGGKVGWDKYQREKSIAESARFDSAVALLDKGDAAAAAAAFANLAKDAGEGYAALARLREAQALIAAGKRDEAVAALDAIAADEALDRGIRDLAALIAVLDVIDTAPADEVERRLAPLVSGDSVWRVNARELQGLAALRRGERDKAREIFNALSEEANLPPALRRRVTEYMAILGGAKKSDS